MAGEFEGRLGWEPVDGRFIPVTIVSSVSGCDETVIGERTHPIEARLGMLDDSRIVPIDPKKDTILQVFPSSNGFQKVTVEFKVRGGTRIEDVFIPVV